MIWSVCSYLQQQVRCAAGIPWLLLHSANAFCGTLADLCNWVSQLTGSCRPDKSGAAGDAIERSAHTEVSAFYLCYDSFDLLS